MGRPCGNCRYKHLSAGAGACSSCSQNGCNWKREVLGYDKSNLVFVEAQNAPGLEVLSATIDLVAGIKNVIKDVEAGEFDKTQAYDFIENYYNAYVDTVTK